jgi:hypothetical protein
MTTAPDEVWRKATFSGQDSDCVEVSSQSRVRDSKNPDGGALPGAVDLVHAAKAELLNRRR